jgi:ferredoxin-type protein NapH
LLAIGLGLTALLAVPVLGYVYPPAVLSREIHDFVFALFDRAEHGRFGLWLGGTSWMTAVIGSIVAIELFVSRRWWCRYVCPGGALYSLLGTARPLRVKLRHERCTECALCVAACPMGLNPMKNEMGVECDNCGVCISSCEDDALGYGVASVGSREASKEAA